MKLNKVYKYIYDFFLTAEQLILLFVLLESCTFSATTDGFPAVLFPVRTTWLNLHQGVACILCNMATDIILHLYKC